MELLMQAAWRTTAWARSMESSVLEILEEAGLSTKAFYRLFRSKDDLLLVALEQVLRRQSDFSII